MSSIKDVRDLFQDLVAPGVARLDERIGGLLEKVEVLAKEVEHNRAEIKELWAEIAIIRDKTSHLSGRLEGVKQEIVADVKVALLTGQQSRRQKGRLPPDSEKGR